MRWLAVLVATVTFCLGAAGAIAATVPVDNGAVQARPAFILLSEDGAVLLSGVTNAHPRSSTPGDPMGRLHWTVWTATQGTATGAEWMNDCTPDCASGVYHIKARATVHVFAPNHSGMFTRMTVTIAGHADSYQASHALGEWSFI